MCIGYIDIGILIHEPHDHHQNRCPAAQYVLSRPPRGMTGEIAMNVVDVWGEMLMVGI